MRRDAFTMFWLMTTAAACGAAVMAVELLGARMLSVGYGASLLVWAAMISVTLLSLAVGYFIGGFLADRRPSPALLHGIVLAAGALLAVCPHLRFVLKLCYDAMGLEAGALVSSLAIFFLPLCLFGMVSPFVIKLISQQGRGVGMTAGGVYAISTIGSVVGTLATGLYLIPVFGTPAGFRIIAVATALTAGVGLVIALGAKGAASLFVAVAVGFVPSPSRGIGHTWTAPDGSRVVVKDIRDSAHGRIVVLEKGDYRLLVVNGIVQTGVSRNLSVMAKGEHLLIPYFQELLPYTVNDPASRNALIIGLAGGLTASLLQQHGMEVESVDLDPEIIAAARKWFSFKGPATAADGRRFLEGCSARYDFCVIDTYSGDAFPFYMASVEAFRAARAVLKPGGVLAVNFIGSPSGRAFASVYRTLREVFPNVLALNGEDSDDVQTITVFASDREIGFNKSWLDSLGDFSGSDPVSESIKRLTVVPTRSDALLLTDAWNPVDTIRSREAVRWRQRTIENIGEEALF